MSSNSSDSDSESETTMNIIQNWEKMKELYREYEAQQTSNWPTKKKKTYVWREREEADRRLVEDYFAKNPRLGASVFRRRFRMRRSILLRIVNTLEARELYFQQRPDALRPQGISPLVKCTVALRQLANGGSADQYDEYLHVAETTGIECLKNFCRAVIDAFGAEYLRKPNSEDCCHLLQMHEEKHDFPGMLGSIDFMHWTWKNCPTTWVGAFTCGDKGKHPLNIRCFNFRNFQIEDGNRMIALSHLHSRIKLCRF